MKFLKKYKEIFDGWKNFVFPTPELKAMAEERAKICASCPLNRSNTCDRSLFGAAVKDFTYRDEKRYKGSPYKGCGCPLDQKTMSPNSKCPLGKFPND